MYEESYKAESSRERRVIFCIEDVLEMWRGRVMWCVVSCIV
jgi:hypothetical protein